MTSFGSVNSAAGSSGAPEPESFVPAPVPQPVDQSPLAPLLRALRGRWRRIGLMATVVAPVLGGLGFASGTKLYQSDAIVRVYPQEASVLYRTGDDSVLKTFDSYVKAETSYIASPNVIDRATKDLASRFPEDAGDMTPSDLLKSIDIKRTDSLITLTTKSKNPRFSAEKLQAVADAYLALHAETEERNAAVRLAQLQAREKELEKRQQDNQQKMLEVGGEYGVDSLAKAHSDKVEKIETLSARKDDVEGTIASMKAKNGQASADTSGAEIMRTILLDRGLADLNFERAKRRAALSSVKERYPENSPQVRDASEELALIDQAMSDRRSQITVLGQTGALTDSSSNGPQTSIEEIQALADKIATQLAAARVEARDLNARMIQLDSLKTEAANVAKLLEDTRQGIEIITVETGKALPGYSVLMSAPVVADKPASNNAKVRGAAGFGGGLAMALIFNLIAGLIGGRVGYSDALARYGHLVPIRSVVERGKRKKADYDRLRNALQLQPLRVPPLPESTRVVAVTRLDIGAPFELAQGLANSFAEARTRTLLIDADTAHGILTRHLGKEDEAGWRELLEGKPVQALAFDGASHLDFLPVGHASGMADAEIGISTIRAALSGLKSRYELIILLCGSLSDSISTDLLLSVSDLALGEVEPKDSTAAVVAQINKLDSLPRQGGVLAFSEALPGDPGL